MAQILDGRAAAAALEEGLSRRVAALGERKLVPGLTLVRVGEDPASVTYVRSKERACRRVGIRSETLVLPTQTNRDDLLAVITGLNANPAVHGILLQLPLPRHLMQEEFLAAVDPRKDVDGFNPVNAGRLCLGIPGFVPATPLGIVRMLQHYAISVAGKRVVILGRSRIVGRPLANLLSAQRPEGNATVTVCHSQTRELPAIARTAEILIAAVGHPRFVGAEMVAPGAIVIDVGIHGEPDPERPGKQRLCGDVDFAAVQDIVSAISPVPGGVGPMTVACVVENTVQAAEGSLPATE